MDNPATERKIKSWGTAMQSEGREGREARAEEERKREGEEERKGEGGVAPVEQREGPRWKEENASGERVERAKREQKEAWRIGREGEEGGEIGGRRQRVSVRTVSGRWLYVRVLDRRPVLFYESQYFTRQLDSRGGHH